MDRQESLPIKQNKVTKITFQFNENTTYAERVRKACHAKYPSSRTIRVGGTSNTFPEPAFETKTAFKGECHLMHILPD